MSYFVKALGYKACLAIPEKDVKNYTLKAYFHLGKILKYALTPKRKDRQIVHERFFYNKA